MANERALGGIRLRVRGLQDAFRSLSNRILIRSKDREDRLAAATQDIPSIQERQHDLLMFYGNYEQLVETLCDAAQFGPKPGLDSEYLRLRAWMIENYPSVRRYVVAFLRYSADDAAQGLALNGRSADAFEALVAAESLEDFLKADDGTMISRIDRTREALILYGEHLRK